MEELTCPICLISSTLSSSTGGNEEQDDPPHRDGSALPSSLDGTTTTTTTTTTAEYKERPEVDERPIFVQTPCNHIFCQSCIEHVLLQPPRQQQQQQRMPPTTRGPCPMCRVSISLFDLRLVPTHYVTGVVETSATTTNEKKKIDSGNEEERFVYRSDSNAHSWPIANCRYKQRLLLPSSSSIQEEDSSILMRRRLFEQGGIIEGYGIEFCFTTNSSDDECGGVPLVLFSHALMLTSNYDDDNDNNDNNFMGDVVDQHKFNYYYFHRDSMTFYGKIIFSNDNNLLVVDGFHFSALECLLNFATPTGQYIRTGELRWKYANTTSERTTIASETAEDATTTNNTDLLQNNYYPLDGSWEVRYQSSDNDGSSSSNNIINNNTSFVIHVQSHTFKINDETITAMMPRKYQIIINENNHQLCMVPIGSNSSILGRRQQYPTYTSNKEVLPNNGGEFINIGETITWTIDSSSDNSSNIGWYRNIIWTRRTLSLEDCYKVVPITVGTFVYQKISTTTATSDGGDDQQLGPRFNSNTVWGNTFCQGLCVGMASYHFMNTNDCTDSTINGSNSSSNSTSYQAYISYESPRTELWPPLDNGNAIPSRVPFRNIRWNDNTRTFHGDICWLDDYNTTWMNETMWSYIIVFDPTYSFIASGSVSMSDGDRPHQFGIDLIYINAALETPLRDRMLQQQQQTTMGGQSSGAYLDIVRQWRDVGHASTATLDMLGEVAMGVMDNRESMIDFNL